jgi:hypothetical protein
MSLQAIMTIFFCLFLLSVTSSFIERYISLTKFRPLVFSWTNLIQTLESYLDFFRIQFYIHRDVQLGAWICSVRDTASAAMNISAVFQTPLTFHQQCLTQRWCISVLFKTMPQLSDIARHQGTLSHCWCHISGVWANRNLGYESGVQMG